MTVYNLYSHKEYYNSRLPSSIILSKLNSSFSIFEKLRKVWPMSMLIQADSLYRCTVLLSDKCNSVDRIIFSNDRVREMHLISKIYLLQSYFMLLSNIEVMRFTVNPGLSLYVTQSHRFCTAYITKDGKVLCRRVKRHDK